MNYPDDLIAKIKEQGEDGKEAAALEIAANVLRDVRRIADALEEIARVHRVQAEIMENAPR